VTPANEITVAALVESIHVELRNLRADMTATEAEIDAVHVALDNARDELREAIGVLRDLLRGHLPRALAVEWLTAHEWQLDK
jgi:uncharacterized protein YaaN involved in tellurite resistance